MKSFEFFKRIAIIVAPIIGVLGFIQAQQTYAFSNLMVGGTGTAVSGGAGPTTSNLQTVTNNGATTTNITYFTNGFSSGGITSDLNPTTTHQGNVGVTSTIWKAGRFDFVSSSAMIVTGAITAGSVSTSNISIGGRTLTGAESITLENSVSSTFSQVGQLVTASSNQRMVKVGNQIWTADYSRNSVSVIDVTTPSSPTLAYSTTSATNFPSPWALATDGRYVVVTNQYTGAITLFDSSYATSSQPKMIVQGSVATTGTAAAVMDGHYLYTFSSTGTLNVTDYSNLANVQVSTPLSLAGSNGTVAYMVKDGNFLYIAGVSQGIFGIVDVTNPMVPVIAKIISGIVAFDVKVQNRKAYIPTYTNNQILVYDVTDPWNATLLVTVSNASIIPSNLAVAGQYMYVSEFNSVQPITVWDIYSSSTPRKIGQIGYGNFGFSEIIVSGEYVYALDHNGGVNSLAVFPAAHLQAQAAHIGSTYTGLLEVGTDAKIDNNLSVFQNIYSGSGLSAKGFSYMDNLSVVNTTSSRAYVQKSVGTSTLTIGTSTGGGSCLELGDADGSGFSYCVINNGTLSCSTTSCK